MYFNICFECLQFINSNRYFFSCTHVHIDMLIYVDLSLIRLLCMDLNRCCFNFTTWKKIHSRVDACMIVQIWWLIQKWTLCHKKQWQQSSYTYVYVYSSCMYVGCNVCVPCLTHKQSPCIFMRECVCLFVYVWVYIFVYIDICVWIKICMYTYIHTYTHVCTYICTYVCVWGCVYTYMYSVIFVYV